MEKCAMPVGLSQAWSRALAGEKEDIGSNRATCGASRWDSCSITASTVQQSLSSFLTTHCCLTFPSFLQFYPQIWTGPKVGGKKREKGQFVPPAPAGNEQSSKLTCSWQKARYISLETREIYVRMQMPKGEREREGYKKVSSLGHNYSFA